MKIELETSAQQNRENDTVCEVIEIRVKTRTGVHLVIQLKEQEETGWVPTTMSQEKRVQIWPSGPENTQ